MGRIDWENHKSLGPGLWEIFFDYLRILVTFVVISTFLIFTFITKFTNYSLDHFLFNGNSGDTVYVVVIMGTIGTKL
jgi:hypothetical protein